MRKVISRFAVVLATFAIGNTISNLTSSKPPSEPYRAVAQSDYVLSVRHSEEPANPTPPPSFFTGPADLLVAVRINSIPPSFRMRSIEFAKDQPIIGILDLDEDIQNVELILNGTDNFARYRIFQRYRTSISISDEGPHLDLVDWRHFDSTWIPLRQLDARRFRTLASNQMGSTKFPPTTNSDIIKAVRRRVGTDWSRMLELAKTCDGPNDAPCEVGISSVYLRIQKQIRGRWVNVGLVEFRLPMGC